MTWNNGTVTTIEQEGAEVVVTDTGERFASGLSTVRYRAQEALDLADEHDKLSRMLRTAAISAQRHENAQPDS
jgi:hypothetical protein